MDVPYKQKLSDWAMLVAAWRERNRALLQTEGAALNPDDMPPAMPIEAEA